MPPTVRTLDELYKLNGSVYDPQRQNIDQQIGQTQQSGQAEEQGLYAVQNQAFKNINQMASNKGMLFSGFSPDQQAQYNSTKFMPAIAGLRGKIQDNIARLQSARLTLDSDQRKEAMGMQEKDLSQLYDYNKEQDRRKFEKEQADVAYQREMEKLKTQAALSNSAKAASEPPRYDWHKNQAGGYEVVINGQKASVDLATAVASRGGGIQNLISLLMNGDAQDKKAAQQYLKDVQKDATMAYANLVSNRGTAFYTGGGF